MTRFLIIAAAIMVSSVAYAQPAVLEIEGVIWERTTPYVAIRDSLLLHKRPDLRSEEVVIPYRAGWKVPVSATDGVTRILSIGALRFLKRDEYMSCSVAPTEGSAELAEREEVEYLRYLGEGFGEIRFRGGICQAEVDPMLGHFELISSPEVQRWYPMYYADGTSPGWMLNDGSQVR